MPERGRDCTGILMKAIQIACQKLFFNDVQPEEKEPLATLLLVHGVGGSHLSWRRQIEKFSDRFRVIAVDLPGHGLSEGEGKAVILDYARYVVELMESLGLHNVILGGHSMGGAVALEVALRFSSRLGALLLVGTGARLRVLPAIFSTIRQDFEPAIKGMTNFMFASGTSVELINEESQLLARSSADLILRDFTACDSFDVTDEIGSIKLPTLILCGREDRLMPAKYSEFLHENISDSELVIFDKCGHMPMLERSSDFNECVSSFVMRL
ncbi:MAG: alpha/beta hydrolase [Candidatus Hydrogenedentota bacterium]|nr:MAG: alpha/beta hydrolase [Candidatus Hydrogenedentota bacterium]